MHLSLEVTRYLFSLLSLQIHSYSHCNSYFRYVNKMSIILSFPLLVQYFCGCFIICNFVLQLTIMVRVYVTRICIIYVVSTKTDFDHSCVVGFEKTILKGGNTFSILKNVKMGIFPKILVEYLKNVFPKI